MIIRIGAVWEDDKPCVFTNDPKVYQNFLNDETVRGQIIKRAEELLKKMSDREIPPWTLELIA